ncbi:MAG: hypothetical protein EOO61_03430 [Hymenobacter sp.]|nr:MAG: hypothetical protein EOO61_03430 [Hymenobacter sp.]
MTVNLYRISQNENNGWDTYDSAVVAAENEEAAKRVHPSEYSEFFDEENKRWYSLSVNGDRYYGFASGDWARTVDEVKVELIGTAVEGIQPGQRIVTSFNAG